jgi:hypothetical protein
MIHTCKLCDFTSEKLSNFNLHLATKKHQKNQEIFDTKKHQKVVEKKLTNIAKTQYEQTKFQKQQAKIQKKELKQINTKIEEVHKTAKKAKEYSKSCLTLLNKYYKNNPPLTYPGDELCKKAIYKYFNVTEKENEKTNVLARKIMYYLSKDKLVNCLIDILLPILKETDINKQTVLNTDTSRCNYVTKLVGEWKSDKAGVYLIATMIKPFCNIIVDVVQKYVNDYKQYIIDNEEDILGERVFEEHEKLQEIKNCLFEIKDQKLYNAIIYKLSSNLHYKSLIDLEVKLVELNINVDDEDDVINGEKNKVNIENNKVNIEKNKVQIKTKSK